MPRHKQVHPMVKVVRSYLRENVPEMQDAPLRIHQLDGPPGAPRYTATVEVCTVPECPYGVTHDLIEAGKCPVLACALRNSVRLLLDRQGTVVQEMHTGLHWR